MIGAGIPAPSYLYILFFILFEPTIEGIGTESHFFLKPYSCNSARFPLLIQLPEFYPVDSDRLPTLILALRLCNGYPLALTL